MVRKPNGSYRFCLDFRKLNTLTKKDTYPLPQMTEILDKLRNDKCISRIDLFKGFLQIPLDPGSREKTAFTVPRRGSFQFKRMPFGLTNAPATFHRLLDRLIGLEVEPHAFAYLDDIIIVTRTFEEHLEWLARVLDKIKDAGLEINPDKCEFCCQQVHYLCFLVNEEGLQVDTDKIEPVFKYPVPRNVRELRGFLGIASSYRQFIPNFTSLASPLNCLLKKNHARKLRNEQAQAFKRFKRLLVQASVLSCPDIEIPFCLHTHASLMGLGAVLTQTVKEVEYVLSNASRSLSDQKDVTQRPNESAWL